MPKDTTKKADGTAASDKKSAKRATAAKSTKKTTKAAKKTTKTAKKTTKTAKKTTSAKTAASAKKKTAETEKPAKKKTAKKAATKKTEKSLRVRQVRSGIRHPHRMRRTLTALGLKHHQDEVVVPDNPSIRGMLRRVHHLVSVMPEETNG